MYAQPRKDVEPLGSVSVRTVTLSLLQIRCLYKRADAPYDLILLSLVGFRKKRFSVAQLFPGDPPYRKPVMRGQALRTSCWSPPSHRSRVRSLHPQHDQQSFLLLEGHDHLSHACTNDDG